MTIPHHLSDRYELGEILGFGGMSEVHRGRDVRLQRDVAVKILRAELARDPGFYLRFRREAQNAAALNHPAIVAIYDTGEAQTPTGPLPYIVMEVVDGVTLRDVVNEDGPMEADHAIEVIADACQALDFSHRHGIVHRDVKPANIMISTTGAVKVMDFGIARTLADTTGGSRLTQTAAVLGTAAYLSPEQAGGETVDARSDVYALGCVLYEMLTGAPPFAGDTPVAVAYQHVRQDAVPPSRRRSGISPEMDAVVMKALSKNPENRYQSAAEMRTDLIRVRAGEAPHAPKVLTDADQADSFTPRPDGHQRGHRPTGSVRRWLIPAVALTVLTIVTAIVVHAVGSTNHAVRVPDVHGQAQQDAIATLQGLGFKIRGPVLKPDPTLTVGQVIDTDPGAHTLLAGGDEITIDVSQGPDQRPIPDCANLTLDVCVSTLATAGFPHPKPASTSSLAVPNGRVLATIPAAGQLTPVINDIIVEVSSGPEAQRVPDVSGQTAEQATTNLKAAGFQIVLSSPIDGLPPSGQVLATDPAAGSNLSVRSAVMLKVSRGNQVPMPNLIGKTYLEILPLLQDRGIDAPPSNGGDVPSTPDNKSRAVQQDPPPGTPVNRDATITVNYGA